MNLKIIFLFILTVLVASAFAQQFHSVPIGGVEEINQFAPDCDQVTNNCMIGIGIFIPTNTQNEFDVFKANAPGCINSYLPCL